MDQNLVKIKSHFILEKNAYPLLIEHKKKFMAHICFSVPFIFHLYFIFNTESIVNASSLLPRLKLINELSILNV